MPFTLAELAQRFGGDVKGDPDRVISGIGSLQSASPADITFLANSAYHKYLAHTAAAAVILEPREAEGFAGNCLVVDNPYACFAGVAELLHPWLCEPPGIHDTAVVHEHASIAETAWIGAHAVIDERVVVGDRSQIGSGCWIGRGSVIGEDARLYAHVSVYPECRVGKRSIIHSGAVIGSDGFGYANQDGRWIRIPQLGRAIVGDDVSVGANTTIDRGGLEDTVIGDGVILDNQIQIAHNVRIGEHTAMAGCVGIAGSTRIGKRCTFGGRAGVLGHLEITDDVHVTATSLVTHSLRKPGTYSSITPLENVKKWRNNAARMRHLDEMARRLKQLENEIAALIKSKNSQ